eukprot:scaffold8841_cov53-Phaeocystis_antarctica.AAC.3
MLRAAPNSGQPRPIIPWAALAGHIGLGFRIGANEGALTVCRATRQRRRSKCSSNVYSASAPGCAGQGCGALRRSDAALTPLWAVALLLLLQRGSAGSQTTRRRGLGGVGAPRGGVTLATHERVQCERAAHTEVRECRPRRRRLARHSDARAVVAVMFALLNRGGEHSFPTHEQ